MFALCVCVTFLLYPRSQHFEVQQAELQQQLLGLQKDLATMKQLYDSLLEQVDQQSSFLQQLSQHRVSHTESERTEAVGEF